MESLGLVDTTPSGGGVRWRVFERGGRVLMLLSDQKPDFVQGLSLYLPLRRLACLVVKGLVSFPMARRVLPSISLEVDDQGACGKILVEMKVSPLSFLFGNPDQRERRAIMLCRAADESLQVAKIGVSTEAREKVSCEAELLSKLKSDLPEAASIPPLLGRWKGDRWDAFQLPFFQTSRRQEWTMSELVKILKTWVSGEKSDAFLKGDPWKGIECRLEDEEAGEARSLELAPSLRHGDFTPWNILESADSEPVVIDWEFAGFDSIPGWDLVHFICMSSHLVEQVSKEATLQKVKRVLREDPDVRGYLKQVGWSGHEDLLLKSYLLMMGGQLEGFLELLPSWQSLGNGGES